MDAGIVEPSTMRQRKEQCRPGRCINAGRTETLTNTNFNLPHLDFVRNLGDSVQGGRELPMDSVDAMSNPVWKAVIRVSAPQEARTSA
jgi:hypothetical protein